MIVKEFSEESVKLAEAANLLGLDCVEKYEKRSIQNHSIYGVRLIGVNRSLEIDKSKFPELEIGDKISLLYVMHFEDCNKVYEKCNMYQPNNS